MPPQIIPRPCERIDMTEMLEKRKRTIGSLVNGIAENILFALFTVMVVIVFINVVARYVFNSSIIESEEIARYCFVWASLVGAVLALGGNEHIGVDFVVKMLPKRARKVVLIVANLCVLALTAICAWYGYVLAETTFGWPSPATRIPYGYVGMVVPISFAAMFVIVLFKTIAVARSDK